MDKEKAKRKAESFKEEWEIYPKEESAVHKKTQIKFSLEDVFEDSMGKKRYSVSAQFVGDPRDPSIPSTPFDKVGPLERQFAILYEAGYLPGKTLEELEEEARRNHEEVLKLREQHEREADEQAKYWQEHPEEYEEMIRKNIEDYNREQAEWYIRRGWPVPDKYKNNER